MKRGAIKINDLIFVKEFGDGEHCAGFIQFVPDDTPVTWPPAEDLPMMFVIKNGDGSLAIKDLTSANASHRLCPAPAGFGPEDSEFISLDEKGVLKVDWEKKAAHFKVAAAEHAKKLENQRWNEMSVMGRIANAIRPKRT